MEALDLVTACAASATSSRVRRRVGRPLAVLCLALLVIGGASACEPATPTLRVTVTRDGGPVDANVRVWRGDDNRYVETGPDGFADLDLPAGTWSLEAWADGGANPSDPLCRIWYHPASSQAVTITAGQTAQANVDLVFALQACQ